MRRTGLVFVGGGLGAVLRALMLQWLNPLAALLPAPVLAVNLVGAFLLGVVLVLADEARILGSEARVFLATGLLGGYTTFSTMDWGADVMFARGGAGLAYAVAYLAASVCGGVVAAYFGIAAGRRFAHRAGGGHNELAHAEHAAGDLVETEDRRESEARGSDAP